nr:MmcQ/YjbR family DNA-binding protein [Prevotella sp.]
EQIREYTLSLPGVTEDQAFGEDILNFRLEGKIFVCLWLGGGRYDMKDRVSRIALKLSPDRNIELREQFSDLLNVHTDILVSCTKVLLFFRITFILLLFLIILSITNNIIIVFH